MGSGAPPGWYGKLPGLGDFAGRRLPPPFVDAWDRWLASGLAWWKDADDDWLDAYLAAPTWRFALGARVPFAQSPGYAGVLMPSVDRVGRYFPLTVVRPRGEGEARAPAAWLRALEGVAIAALDGDWNAEALDAALADLAAPGLAATGPAGSGPATTTGLATTGPATTGPARSDLAVARLVAADHAVTGVAAAGPDEPSDADPAWPPAGRALWWHERDGVLSPTVSTSGLPEAAALVRLLAGRIAPAEEDDERGDADTAADPWNDVEDRTP